MYIKCDKVHVPRQCWLFLLWRLHGDELFPSILYQRLRLWKDLFLTLPVRGRNFCLPGFGDDAIYTAVLLPELLIQLHSKEYAEFPNCQLPHGFALIFREYLHKKRVVSA